MADSNNDKTNIINNIKSKINNIFEKIKPLLNKTKSNIYIIFSQANTGLQKINDIQTRLDSRIKIAIYIILSLIFIIILSLIIFNKKKPLSDVYKPIVSSYDAKIDNSTKIKSITSSELQNLAKKAALLYSSGQISAALDIYYNLSLFSQSFSSFNLGVAKFKDRNYKEAINSFKDTIDTNENVSPAALNAAISSYMLGNNKDFERYILLANGTLTDWSLSPLYSYLYSLVNYYLGNYFNTLSSLKHPTSDFYPRENSLLLAKMYLAFNDDYNALKEMIKNPKADDNYTIGLLYARIGDYDMAITNINSYLANNQSDKSALMAKALVEIKRSNFIQTSEIYEQLLQTTTDKELQKIYPIKIKLNDSLFDANSLQKNFWKIANVQYNSLGYKLLFYFAPFKVFDTNKSVDMLQQGSIYIKMNNLKEASDILMQTKTLSRVNLDIVNGLKEIYNSNIYNALSMMKKAEAKYPNHQSLQYNLGLIYAQLNDFDRAYRHFIKAYHLDNNDLLSGIFALMSSKLINKDSARLLSEITFDFDSANFNNEEDELFLRSLFGFVNGNLSDGMLWFKKDNKDIFKHALYALYAINSNDKIIIIDAFLGLKNVSNGDVISNILYQLSLYYNDSAKFFSIKLFNFLKSDLKDLTEIYSGSYVARELYVYLAFLAGANHYVDSILNEKMINSNKNIIGIMETLALNSIYTNNFEKAFTLYNALIDDYKLNDSNTYFLAGVSAIGAGHYDNAVALMQLSRLESGINLDTRFALALLYQSIGNFKLASMQFLQINDNNFKSKYFDFIIDTSDILKDSIEK